MDHTAKPSRRPNVIEAAMRYKEITLSITGLLVLAGLWALFTMPRMEDPDITIRQGIVLVLYPGASETEVESQVTDQLEQYLFSFKEIRKEKTYSTSKAGESVVVVQLQDWVKDKDRFWATLQHGLNAFRQKLPKEVIGPLVNSDFGETVAVMLTVSSPGRSYAELDKYTDQLENGIKTIRTTSKIRRYGGQAEQYWIKLDNDKLRQYGFDALQVANVLQAQNGMNFSGSISVAQNVVPVYSNNRFRTADDMLEQVIFTDPMSNVVRLKDIATLERGYEDERSFIKIKGQRAMMLSVEMQPGNNIVAFGNVLTARIEEIKAQMPSDVEVNVVTSQPKVVSQKLSEFMVEFLIAIGSVILVVLLLLPFRMAVISAVASPVSVLITFAALYLLGYEIHQVTLAALIICLGMVVDDAIVVVDNYIELLDHGTDRWEAAWKSATQLFVPIFTATATIIFAFLPLMFTLKGLPNEFVSHLPPTIAIALGCSFLVAIFLTPLLCFVFVKKGLAEPRQTANRSAGILDRVQLIFDRMVDWAFARWQVTIGLSVLSIILAGVIGAQIPPEFLPIAERDQFNIEVYMRDGTRVQETEKAVDRIVSVLSQDPRAKDIISFVGTSSPRFYSTYAPEAPRENYAQIFINTVNAKATVEMVREYLDRFEPLVPNGQVRLRQLSFQEELAPIEIRIVGDNIADLKATGARIEAILQKNEATNFVRNDFGEEYYAGTLAVDHDRASLLGLSNQGISRTLGSAISGYPLTTVWEANKAVGVAVRLNEQDRKDLQDINRIFLTNQTGAKVALAQVATLRPEWRTGNIIRRNGLRTLTVRSEAQRGTVAAWVLAGVRPEIEKLSLPPGISIEYGGDDEATRENMPDLVKALGISALLIFMTLLFQFGSIRKSFIILFAFPLSLFGAMLGLYLSGNHAGFTTFLGITSLIGIVVRNGIILVDYADELMREGYSLIEAAKASAKRRMRPIFLTSSAAAVGVLPMIFGNSPLWAPMGSILAMGLMFSMFMTLFTIPVLYTKLLRQTPAPAKASLAGALPG